MSFVRPRDKKLLECTRTGHQEILLPLPILVDHEERNALDVEFLGKIRHVVDVESSEDEEFWVVGDLVGEFVVDRAYGLAGAGP